MLKCALCGIRACDGMDESRYPAGCPSREDMTDIRQAYLTEEDFRFGQVCSEVSMSKQGPRPRILELIEVAQKCGYHKLGLAFCVGFANEAKLLTQVLEHWGFEVVSVICKVGGIDKDLHGIENGGNAMCNPIAQAHLLNEAKTDFNIALGLCVGHDSLFFRHSAAPVTVMATKDKVLAHNPMGALYVSDGYYKNILFPENPGKLG